MDRHPSSDAGEAMTKIRAYDIAMSFDAGSAGYASQQVMDGDGKAVLGEPFWTAGNHAVLAMKKCLHETNDSDVPTSVIQLSFNEIAQEVGDFLNADIYPLFLKRIDNGTFKISPPNMASKARFIEVWKEYDIVDQALIVFQVFASNPLTLRPEYGVEVFIRKIAAFSILKRIDDAAIAAFMDDHEGLASCSMDIERLRGFLQPPEALFSAIEKAVTSAFVKKAAQGGHAKNQAHAQAKAFVLSEWRLHRSDYGNNKSAFAEIYARRIAHEFRDLKGDPLMVRARTISEVWLKHIPSTG